MEFLGILGIIALIIVIIVAIFDFIEERKFKKSAKDKVEQDRQRKIVREHSFLYKKLLELNHKYVFLPVELKETFECNWQVYKNFDEKRYVKDLLKTKPQIINELFENVKENENIYKEYYKEFCACEEYTPEEQIKKIRHRKMSVKRFKELRKGTAATCAMNWRVNGSEKEGKKLIAESIKQIIRNFNIECDICIGKVKFSNYENTQNRIYKAFEMQNRLNETNKISLSRRYLLLKLEELALAYEYQQKKKEERELQCELREQQREEARIAKEIEAKRLELEKERAHYENALKKINEQIAVEKSEERKQFLLERKEELDNNALDVDKALQDLDYREANHRAGYVYIISNIGAFGENVYKIGMTRRLDPEDRISELSGAAVPFRFDVHAMIFSNDAPKLEAALHNAFADKKMNLVNGRKEFFMVTLEEIKKVVEENHDKTVDFINVPDAQQYRETVMIRKKLGDKNDGRAD